MLDTLSDWGGTGNDDWSNLEKPIKPPTLPATNPAYEQAWNQASSGGAAAPQADLLQQTGVAGTGGSTPASSWDQPAPGHQNAEGTATTHAVAAPPVDYSTHVAAVQQAATPQESAVKRDTLARTLATDLTNDGHEVSWEGEQLIVDGRPYEVAGAPGFLPGDSDPLNPGPWEAGPVAKTTDPAAAQAQTNYQLPGFDTAKLNDPNLVGPGKYSAAVKEFASQIQNLPPTTASLQTVVAHARANGFPNAQVIGSDRIDYGDGNGPIDVITDVGGANAGWWFQNGPDRFATPAAAVGAPTGAGTPGAGGTPATPVDPYRVADYSLPGWDAVMPGGGAGPLPEYIRESGDPLAPSVPTEAPLGPTSPASPAAPPNYDALWQGTAPTYTPGSLGAANTPGYQDTLDAAGSYTPGGALGDVQGGNYTAGTLDPATGKPYQAGTLGPADTPWTYESLMQELQSGNPVEGNTDALINRILQHPESMDPQTVAMLKAQSDEETGQAALSEDQAAKRFGFGSGIADSPWLASERAATARSADASQIANRRTIDLKAAETNAADRLKAASLGAAYQGQRAGQKQAAVSTSGSLALGKAGEERSRFATTEEAKQAQAANELAWAGEQRSRFATTEAAKQAQASTELAKAGEQRSRFATNEQTKQASAASRQQAVSLAVDTAFKGAAEGRDRFALNESLKAQATKLGIDQDTLTQNYVTNTLADLTKRYGIDVGANLDTARLKEQSREFQQDLLVKIQQMKVTAAQWQAQMQQRDREFGSTLGLNYDQLNSSNLNNWWNAAAGGA